VYRILRWGEGVSRTQTRVIFSLLVLAVLGGAAELSRCPQLVSFSPASLPQTTLPLPHEAQILPATGNYQNVVFHPSAPAHETLLKASMPSAQPQQPQTQPATQVRHVRRAALQRTSQREMRASNQPQQWVVLTSWSDESYSARMVLTVAREQTSHPTYAAVPTVGGWLVIPL
jgi:hypothetical protein